MTANDKQVGGDHYRKISGEQHWDRVYRLFGAGYFIGCATKYAERYHLKNGKEDLEKAIHFLQKLIELEYPQVEVKPATIGDTPPYAFKKYEKDNPQYLHNRQFLCEGGSGDGMNLYRCRGCKELVWASGLQEAVDAHPLATVLGHIPDAS